MNKATAAFTWPGPCPHEAWAMFRRAREAGMSSARAHALGCIASYKEGWIFRSTIEDHIGASVRTVQRGITQAKNLGLIGVARAKKGEIPPGAKQAPRCGWSHRWVNGWGEAYQRAKEIVEKCRLARIAKKLVDPIVTKLRRARNRPMTKDEIDAELERLDELRKPPD